MRLQDTNTFATLRDMIAHLSRLPQVVGILEYGSRCADDLSAGGDYDLTVVLDAPLSRNVDGVHLHVAGIPVDCMLLCVADFDRDAPRQVFHLAHLGSTILYDRDGTMRRLLDHIEAHWPSQDTWNDSDSMWLRFASRHTLDKLRHRLHDDELYTRYFIGMTAGFMLDNYAKLYGLPAGKPKVHWAHMQSHDAALYADYAALYSTTDVRKQFDALERINAHIADAVGGMWADDELLFHLTPDGIVDVDEQRQLMQLLFGGIRA